MIDEDREDRESVDQGVGRREDQELQEKEIAQMYSESKPEL